MAKKIKDLRKELISIGDSAKDNYENTKSLNAAKIAVQAYSNATKTAIAQIRYKELTGNPTKINFLED
jgi:hypothetical protein